MGRKLSLIYLKNIQILLSVSPKTVHSTMLRNIQYVVKRIMAQLSVCFQDLAFNTRILHYHDRNSKLLPKHANLASWKDYQDQISLSVSQPMQSSIDLNSFSFQSTPSNVNLDYVFQVKS